MKAPAKDLLDRDRLSRLGPSIRRVYAEHRLTIETQATDTVPVNSGWPAAPGSAVDVPFIKHETVRGMLQQFVELLVAHLDVLLVQIWMVDERVGELELQASARLCPDGGAFNGRREAGRLEIELIARTSRPYLTSISLDDSGLGNPEWATKHGVLAFAGWPLIVGERLVGAIGLFSGEPLSEASATTLSIVADEIALGIEHLRTVVELREAEERFRFLVSVSGDVLYRHRPDRVRYDYISPSIETLTGFSVDEINDNGFKNIVERIVSANGDELSPSHLHGQGVDRAARPFEAFYLIKTKSGLHRWIADHSQPWGDRAGNLVGLVGVLTDVTERRRIEEQLRQSQKMEIMGQLAGGVAHDFSNLLTVIIAFAEMLYHQLPADSPHREPAELIMAAGESGVSLSRQLLAFSRRQDLEPQILDLNAVIAGTTRMLRRLIGEDISLTTKPDPNIGSVRADPGQLDQVLLNLAANARDAMPRGGTLTISTDRVTLPASETVRHPGAHPGDYVVVTVQDTGTGVDAATRARIFEPFFTTKGVGKGTGLGLAAVYSIVTQQGGFIEVESVLGEGTAMKIHLPSHDRASKAADAVEARPKLPRGHETILLVDDAPGVRRVARQVLERSGYTVLEAEDGEEALSVAVAHAGSIDLVVTDVVMPGMNGRALIERLSTLVPGAKVLFMSGYTDDVVLRNGVVHAEVSLLQKPFTPLQLTQSVRQALAAE